jgi:hypothetical protein
MCLSFLFLIPIAQCSGMVQFVNKTEATPYRAVVALFVSFADDVATVIARASLARARIQLALIVEPGAHRTSTFKAWYALRLHRTSTCAND